MTSDEFVIGVAVIAGLMLSGSFWWARKRYFAETGKFIEVEYARQLASLIAHIGHELVGVRKSNRPCGFAVGVVALSTVIVVPASLLRHVLAPIDTLDAGDVLGSAAVLLTALMGAGATLGAKLLNDRLTENR